MYVRCSFKEPSLSLEMVLAEMKGKISNYEQNFGSFGQDFPFCFPNAEY